MTRTEWLVTLIAALIWLFVITTNAHCGGIDRSFHEQVPCHPGQHTCMTDQECEDEEALFLDMDERSQEEVIDLYNMQYNITPKQLSAPTNLRVE